MSKLLYTLEDTVDVGIYENCDKIAKIYDDKILLTIPEVKWTDNTGSYNETKVSIRDKKVIAAVIKEMEDECEDSAWNLINEEYIYLEDRKYC